MTTLLIVDDHADFRVEARRLLEGEGFSVVAEVSDGRTALETAARLRPDVVLLDVGLPDMDGFEVVARLRAAGLDSRIVLTSSREAAVYGSRIADSRAAGFVEKGDLSGAALRMTLGDA